IVAGRLPETAPLDAILQPTLGHIAPPHQLIDAERAIARLGQAIIEGQRVGILTDYDADGLTSHAVLKSALVRFGLPETHLTGWIGHRLEDGYGISESLVDRLLASTPLPDVVISADCGSSDHATIARLAAAGITVIVTDHHQVPDEGPPPDAYAVVNPNRDDCAYPDGAIAGVMVCWLVMSGLRAWCIAQGHLPETAPKLGDLLDYVALGTVADCVSLGTSPMNRAVVLAGLRQLQRLERPTWRVTLGQLRLSPDQVTAETLAFQIAPRLNARGRIAHSERGLQYLMAASEADALAAYLDLDADNRARQRIEAEMTASAKPRAARLREQGARTLIVVLESGHSGVQGIVASRLVEAFGRPAIVLTPGMLPEQLSGSMRSVPAVDAKGALDRVAGLSNSGLIRYGGHPGAAGLTLARKAVATFADAMQAVMLECYPEFDGEPRQWVDGSLLPEQLNLATVDALASLGPFGRGFEPPLFEGTFEVRSSRVVGQDHRHLALQLSMDGVVYEAIWFGAVDEGRPPVQGGDWIHAGYRLQANEFRGRRLSLVIQTARTLTTDGMEMA
ncbi:MAG: single-stranded-DNA-specific exonuclease RecJ, partial [Litorivicinaceae bacterium]